MNHKHVRNSTAIFPACLTANLVFLLVGPLPAEGLPQRHQIILDDVWHIKLKMGLFRDVVLDVPGRAWLSDVWVRTELNEDFSEARLVVQPTVSGRADGLRWVLRGPEGGVVWQEFMTGHGMDFPLDDSAYRANFTAEIADEILRLRNHPSVFMWCGGNEHYLGLPASSPFQNISESAAVSRSGVRQR